MLRRDFARTLCTLAVASAAATAAAAASDAPTVTPPFWVAHRQRSRVYLLGFGEARDRSWFTPTIQRAFESAPQLWLELDQSRPREELDAVIRQYGRDPERPFPDSLEPAVRERALAWMSELDIKPESVRPLRPWLAYYTFATAFSARKKDIAPSEGPESVLSGLAKQSGKKIGYEKSMVAWIETLARMSDKGQNQYIAWLFDYFDDEKRGLADLKQSWLIGKPDTRTLDRMRTKPELYRVMQPERNSWWAEKIEQLLQTDEVHFIAVGMLHVLGPDGIPRMLPSRGVRLEPLA